MSRTDSYRDFVLEQLGRVANVRTRRMFGGVGIYAGDDFFAIIAFDTLYFKVNDSNRADFESAGMDAFRPYADPTRALSYYQVPIEVLEDADLLALWTGKAVAASRAARSARRRRRT